MPLRYLDGEDKLELWLSEERHGWMTKLDPVEFSEQELAEIEQVMKAHDDLQDMLMKRFGFDRFYV